MYIQRSCTCNSTNYTISVVKLMVSCLPPQIFESIRNSDSKPVCVCEAMTYSQEHVASVLVDVCFSFTDTHQLYVFLEHFMLLFVHHTWASLMGGELKASFPVSRCYISWSWLASSDYSISANAQWMNTLLVF